MIWRFSTSVSTVPSFMLGYEGAFIMEGNVKPDAEVGTFADRKYSQKHKGMQVKPLKIRNPSRDSGNVF